MCGVGIGPVKFAPVGDEWVGYRVIGDVSERAFVFLPTLASNVDVLTEYEPIRTFFERIAEFAGVVLFDRRGTGVSDGVPGRIAPTLEDWADDALAVLDALGLDRVGLMAQALGVAPALLFAAAHPERVDDVVLMHGFARMTSAPGYDVGVPESSSIIDRIVENVGQSWGEGSAFFFVNPHLRDDPELSQWLPRCERATIGRAAAARAYRAWLTVDVRHVVPSVRSRALVMVGTDRWSPNAASRWMAEHLPDARLFEFSNRTNDWWALEGQDAAVGAIEEFVTGARTEAPPARVLATVLLSDIVDSTRRAAEIGDTRWRQLLDEHDRVARSVVSEHRGRFVKQTGDGVLATFDGPARGVECARRLRDALAGLGVPVRTGLHTGEIELRADDVSGVAVHIAARVAGLAGEGEILVSRTVPDLVVGSGLTFSPRGVHGLKGVPGQWELFALAD